MNNDNIIDVNIQLSYDNPEVEVKLVDGIYIERSYNNLLDKPKFNNVELIGEHDGRYYKLANENDLMDGTIKSEYQVTPLNPATSKKYVDDLGDSINDKLMIEPEKHKVTSSNRATSKSYVDETIKIEEDARKAEDIAINDKFMSGEKAVSKENPATSKSYVDNINSTLDAKINKEISDRSLADTAEAKTRSDSDKVLDKKITDEVTARSNADTTLTNNLNSEIKTRGDEDTKLQTNINNTNAKFMSDVQHKDGYRATSQDFVNSSIATNTATFRGSWNQLTELELSRTATYEQIAAALKIKVTTVTNNDYAYVFLTNETKPTEVDVYKRFKYVAAEAAWEWEYNLNNSSFTAAQWAALNSGITETKVSTYDGYASQISAKYTKPSSGIPASDLTADVQNKLHSVKFESLPDVGKTPTCIDDKYIAAKYDDYGDIIRDYYATKEELNNKVDKITGKQLSTNDYTSTEKSKLSGIETGATKTTTDTISGWGYTKNTGTVTKVSSGSGLTGGDITTTGSISHATVAREDTTSSISPAHQSSFTVIDTVETNTLGHVTKVNTKTVTLPEGGGGGGGSDGNQKLKVDGGDSFGANDEISLVAGSNMTITQDLTTKKINMNSKLSTFEVDDSGLLTIGVE